jgi:predicted DNA-binding transcriptional regulator YafY
MERRWDAGFFTVKVKGLKEISWWILGFGDEVEVLKPAELRKLVATHAERMLQKYEDD